MSGPLAPVVDGRLTHDPQFNAKSLIDRKPGTNTYAVTPEGIQVAVFYTKLRARLLHPLLEADKPPAPVELRRALATVERILDDYVTNARLGAAA
jgi:hypothetical protein